MWKKRNSKNISDASMESQQVETTEEALWSLSDWVDQQRQQSESYTEVLERIASGCVSQDDFPSPSDSEVADAVALVARARRQSRLIIWRRAVSIAAVLFLTVVIGALLINQREAQAAVTLADVKQAISSIVYMRTDSYRDGVFRLSSWSGGQGFSCHKDSKGNVVYVTDDPEQKWAYDPQTKIVTISWPGDWYWASKRTALESVSWLFDRYSKYAQLIESVPGKLDGQDVEILEIEGTEQDPLERVVLWCDPQRYLPLKLQRGDRTILFSYPEEGPKSIYDMGVSRDFRVVSTVPSDEVKVVIQKFYNWRQAVYDEALRNQTFGYWTPEHSGQLVEDDYSRENNLVCIEQFTQGKLNEQRPDGHLDYNPPYRKKYYFDPGKNHMWVRCEWVVNYNAPWQMDKTWREGHDIQPFKALHETYEVTEFGQTNEGFWYPKSVERNIVKEYDPEGYTAGFND